jgi:hypothetical protein
MPTKNESLQMFFVRKFILKVYIHASSPSPKTSGKKLFPPLSAPPPPYIAFAVWTVHSPQNRALLPSPGPKNKKRAVPKNNNNK